MKSKVLAALFLLQSIGLRAQVNTPDGNSWGLNSGGRALSITSANGVTYVGGEFLSVGLPMSGHALLSARTGVVAKNLPQITGGHSVNAVVADGSGGWYIGGDFNGNNVSTGVAHILPDGTNDFSWTLAPDDAVFALVLKGSTLYVGGSFSHIGGQARTGLAAINVATGELTDWDPGLDGSVTALALAGSSLCVAGYFTHSGEVARHYLAAFDLASGNLTSWDPNASAAVYAMAANDSTVYVGGDFANVGRADVNYLAALDPVTGSTTTWTPNASATVRAIVIKGHTIYAGGDFTSIGGQESARCVAPLNADTGNVIPSWTNNPVGSSGACNVLALTLQGNTLYIGGGFIDRIDINDPNYQNERNGLAAANASTGKITSWNPSPEGGVSVLAADGSYVYAGGGFDQMNFGYRSNLAAFDSGTGELLPWNPYADAPVKAVAVKGSKVYVGGSFQNIGDPASDAGSTPRNSIAAIDASTGKVLIWDPGSDAEVLALAISGSKLYVGGGGGLLLAYDTGSGNAISWAGNSTPDNAVRSLWVSGDRVYVGGDFGMLGDSVRNYIAALDANTGDVLSWDPADSNGLVESFIVSGSTIYVGGSFNHIGGQDRCRVAALDATTGNATDFDPNFGCGVMNTSEVYDLALVGNILYAADNDPNRRLASFDATTGEDLGWNPAPNDDVTRLAAIKGRALAGVLGLKRGLGHDLASVGGSGLVLQIGGNFTQIGPRQQGGLARFALGQFLPVVAPSAFTLDAVYVSSAAFGWGANGNPVATTQYLLSRVWKDKKNSVHTATTKISALPQSFPYIVNNLLANTSYSFYIQAANPNDQASALGVDKSTQTFPLPPASVSNLKVAALDASSLQWTWKAPTDFDARGSVWWIVKPSTGGPALIVTEPSVILTTTANTAAAIQVQAQNAEGLGTLSKSVTGYTLADIPAWPVEASSFSVYGTSISVAWNGLADGFKLHAVYKSTKTASVAATVSRSTFTGLSQDSTYYFYVQSVNHEHQLNPSDWTAAPVIWKKTHHMIRKTVTPDRVGLARARLSILKTRRGASARDARVEIAPLSDYSSVTILGKGGVLIRRLLVYDGKAVWDGRDEQGRWAAIGKYYALIERDADKRLLKFALKR